MCVCVCVVVMLGGGGGGGGFTLFFQKRLGHIGNNVKLTIKGFCAIKHHLSSDQISPQVGHF